MSDYKAPLEDLRFVMQEVFRLGEFWQTLEGVDELDSDTSAAIIEEAAKVCEGVLAPLNREADEIGCSWEEGRVITPPGFKEAYETFCSGGWCSLGGNPEFDGMGMPKTLVSAIEEMIQGSNIAFGLAPMLTSGAALAINAHGSEAIKSRYLPKMYSGEWAGAMDLTEPHCGTDLGLIRTKATPSEDGTYDISGTKIFITWGEHDMAENIVHLVLAKLPDAPKGSRGISMFLVPKIIPDENGELGQPNSLSCGSLEKKMGIKASATCVMNFDGAKGWLVGEENKGLAAMFTMMNYERLAVGIQGLGVAENAYQSALAYAKDRLQGRSPDGPKEPEKLADNLLVHADVRRMLFTAKAFNEGGRAFSFYLAKWLDLAKFSNDADLKAKGERMTALLTPVAKAFMTDVALESAIHCQQVLGGHGYIREWGQEQHVRDIRITQIYEGTNGIQAMDLVSRKTIATNAALLNEFLEDVQVFIDQSTEFSLLPDMISDLNNALSTLEESTAVILDQAKSDPHAGGAAAVDYLNMFGYVAYAYMWARMAFVAAEALEQGDTQKDFYQSKIKTANFFYKKLLPSIAALKLKLQSGASPTMDDCDGLF